VALLQAFVANAADAYESLAETLTDWLLAPGSVTVEYATEIAEDIGALSAGLHAALAAAHGAPGFEPRPATRDELRGWHKDARTQLDRALEITPGEAGRILRELAPRIAEELTIFEALPTEPLVTRVHGDYHLGQVLIAENDFRIIDFEGEPARPAAERRQKQSPLRDVAGMLRSFSYARWTALANASHAPDDHARLAPLAAEWEAQVRRAFVESYDAAVSAPGAERMLYSSLAAMGPLVELFELEKALYELRYELSSRPAWVRVPLHGIRSLLGPDR
jgi:maltose alpha-D-glucosyltransferase/alpha-amylase